MDENQIHATHPTPDLCRSALPYIMDALYVLSGKWKLPIMISIWEGNAHFGKIKRSLDGITAKTLSNELKFLELNGFVKRIANDNNPLETKYELTDYCYSLGPVIEALRDWAIKHREHITKGVQEV